MRLLAAVAAAGLIGTVTAGGLGYLKGRKDGREAEVARQVEETRRVQTELFKAADEISRQALELERLQREREALVNELEAEAYSAPGAANPGIGADGLRRLQRRWGAP